MKLILSGVRGNLPTTLPNTAFYGGNTSCFTVHSDDGDLVFLDAGSGLVQASRQLPAKGVAHILLTHGHPDHTNGFWFFPPLHSPEWSVHLYLPDFLLALPDWPNQTGMMPLPFKKPVLGSLILHPVVEGQSFFLQGTSIKAEAFATRHVGQCYGYRLHVDGATVVYTGDHEIDRESDPACVRERQWLTGADIAIVDATYNRADYQRGWGHSTWEDWLDVALESGLPRLILSHHLPTRTDADLDQLAEALKARTEGTGLSVHVGIEQAIFSPQGMLSPRITAVSHWLSSFMEETAHLNDTSAALDAILGKSRQVSRADAGTIFLVEGQQLVFSYTHNDTLFPGNAASKFAYLAMALPISEESIAGYAALSGRTLEIPDVFDLPPGAPYHFNDSFDKRTGYATCSILAVPFFGSNGKVLGVMQLINSIDPLTGKPTSFQSGDIANVEALAREAASLIERAQLQRRGIYNVLQMAELHDPAETGAHAERVGAVSAELYQRWAERHGVQSEFLRYSKGCIRLAAMLHDIGKVGISERILKKPGKLNTEEFLIMRQHTRLGAQVLADDTADLAALTRDIARHHHQKWNGQGYADESEEGRLSGEDIPLAARIVSIADVFDALVSPRCYKAPWSFEDSLLYLVDRASEDFDPELVSCWQEILDVVKEIYQRYPERKVKEKAFA